MYRCVGHIFYENYVMDLVNGLLCGDSDWPPGLGSSSRHYLPRLNSAAHISTMLCTKRHPPLEMPPCPYEPPWVFGPWNWGSKWLHEGRWCQIWQCWLAFSITQKEIPWKLLTLNFLHNHTNTSSLNLHVTRVAQVISFDLSPWTYQPPLKTILVPCHLLPLFGLSY